MALARKGQQVAVPSDVLKDPFVLEFADLRESPALPSAIWNRPSSTGWRISSSRMGTGFCFVERWGGKITLPDDNEQILAARYQTVLPTEEELRVELAREREEAERLLRLGSDGQGRRG